MTKIAGSGSASGSATVFISQGHGSADPDPHQNVMDQEHCPKASIKNVQSTGKHSALNREYPALQNMKFPNLFLFCR